MPDARTVACEILDAVLGDGRPLDAVLGEHRALARLEPRDRAQARRIVATVLRRLDEIDARIAACLDRPLADRHARVRNILRAGTAELAFLETPAHAAVDAAVRAAARYRRGAFKGLVNAVLRRIGRDGAGPELQGTPGEANTPGWLLDRWRDAYGARTARAVADAHLADPPLDITLSSRADPAQWAARLDAEILPGGSLRRRAGGNVSDLPGFADGVWWVQDAAAALPAKLLHGTADGVGRTAGSGTDRTSGAGRTEVIDLCAAPGGKTLQLADRGFAVTAVDISDARLDRLRENLARTGLDARIVAADALEWQPESPADAVLLDAPCTATGIIRRRPDIARRRRGGDIRAAAALQDRLLRAAVDMAAPGGVVVYAACSLEPEEGIGRIEALLASGAPVSLDPILPGELPELGGLNPAAVGPDGFLRTLPCHWSERGGMDGFFAARLVRG